MAKGEDITTKFKVDISDLKKGISEANRQIKLANAEFKAASAGMDDWSKSSEGISAKLKQLSSVLTAQNSKLKSYKDQLKAIEETEQKNGKRADELKTKLQQLASQGVSKTSAEYKKYEKALNDVEKEQLANKTAADNLKVTILNQQAAVNSTEKEIKNYNSVLDNLESEADQAEKAVDDLSDEMNNSHSATTKLTDGFTVMKGALASLVADGIRKAASALKDFAGSMITTTAEVKAETAQFEQTFGDMGSTAEAAVKRVADSTGILETRLKTTGAQIYAFARANGSDVPTAMNLMEEALQAAADNAAYYDRSLEDSAETLQSFLKGNYANDAALGVSATEFTRNAKAAELFGMKYNDLTEIQKQQTLLKMVTDSQKVSGAFGQAARESDGWENVMGNLNESWRQFKAQVGTPFLEALIPVIQQITTSFQGWVNSVDWNAFGQTIQNVANKIITGFGWIIDNGPIIISILAGIAAGFVAFKVVSVITSLVNGFKTLFTILKSGQGIMAALNAVMAANPIGLIITAVAALVAGFITLWNTSEEFRNFWIGLWEAIKSACKPVIDSIVNAFKEAWALIKLVWDAVKPYFETLWNNIKVVFSVVKDVLSGYFKLAWEGIKAIWDTVTGYFKAIWDTIAGIFRVVKDVLTGNWKDAWEGIKGIVGTWKEYFSGVWNSIKNVFSGVATFFKNSFQSAWNGVKKIFSNWGSFFSGLWKSVTNIFKKVGTTISDAISGSVKAAVNGVLSGAIKIINGFISAINAAISVINVIPGVNIGKINKLSAPKLERGIGIAKKGHQYLLEGTGNESVVPLDKNKYWVKAVADDMRKELQSGVSSSTSSLTNSNVNNFTQIINAPKAPSRIELYRDARNLLNYTKGRA